MLVGEYILLLFLPGPIQSRKLDPNKSLQINNLSSLFFLCVFERASSIIHLQVSPA